MMCRTMTRRVRMCGVCTILAGLSATQALAQRKQVPSQPTSQEPVQTAQHAKPVTLEVGTGILVPLPQPAATVLSAEPAIARVQPASPTSLFLMGAAAGQTTIVATSDTGVPIVQYDVTVVGAGHARPSRATEAAPAAAKAEAAITTETAASIESAIHRLVPGGTAIHASLAGGRIVLSGSVQNPAGAQQAEAIAHGYAGEKTTVLTDFVVLSSIQVNVRVRIAEMNRTIERQLGFNWQALGNGGGWRLGALTGAATAGAASALPASMTGFPASTFNPLQPLGLASSASQIGAGFTSGRWDLNAVIDALATDQLVTILAEPNLTAQSGEAASFLAGGEFPIPVAGSTGNGTANVTIEFKQFGVSLEVVPTVLSPGRINLRVRPEVSQLSTNGSVSVPIAGGTLSIPALTVRRAETTVELGSGQSFAIAGLLQKATTDSSSAVPGMGDLPVIGALFKSSDFQRGDSEVVIIVTPYLVKPAASPASMQLPTDGYRPATDLDRILLGHQLAQSGGAPLDAGFILK